jgi:hypothetical protein
MIYNIKQAVIPAERKKLLVLLAVLVSLIVLDGLLTIFLVGTGAATEANPILKPIVGESSFLIIKVAGALLISALMWYRFSRLAVVTAWIGVVGYSMIVLWNTSLCLLV